MEDLTSSKLAIRSLLKDSKEKRATSSLTQERAIITRPALIQDGPIETDEKRKAQLRLGKVIFEFFEQRPSPVQDSESLVRGRGRPTKAKSDQAKNVTICLSKDHLDLLDKIEIKTKKVKGRGSKVRFLMDSYIKHQKREKEQVRSVQESLRLVAQHIDTFSRNYKRAEKFTENERSMADLEKSISNLRIITTLLKIDSSDLKTHLSEKEWSTYQFALSWISNKAGDQ
jgi:hypothetical protein